jgi:hypothetical protein
LYFLEPRETIAETISNEPAPFTDITDNTHQPSAPNEIIQSSNLPSRTGSTIDIKIASE